MGTATTMPGPATRSLPERKDDGALIKRFALVVTAGPDAGLSFSSQGDRVVVGTHGSCDLVVKDDTVSRFHCELVLRDDRVLIRDLDSRNGTAVDGVRVAQAYPRSGAILSLGRTQLRFDMAEESTRLVTSDRERLGLLVGRSTAMRHVFALIERAAASDATVLLLGETGTGKEAAAETIHREGARGDEPFVVVDCAAIPGELLESELFGHEKGAFTGAVATRQGAFEIAGRGTVFLDEIGELSPDLQPKLLRVLERREIKRVGSSRYQSVDVRLIAATHRDLRAEVNRRSFRADLYYRLAVLEIGLPALRERREDIPLLVDHLLDALEAPEAEAARLRAPEFLAETARHTWPGNVRELRNYVERCLALGEPTPVVRGASPEPAAAVDLGRPIKEAREAWVAPFERAYVTGILDRHGGNVAAAARAAGVDRITFYRLLWKYGLR